MHVQGFRKIVADRWEFANEYFRKGHKHLLSEIHRRKTSQPPQHFHSHFHTDNSSPLPHFHTPTGHDQIERTWVHEPHQLPPVLSNTDNDYLSMLSEDNQRLRRKNSMLLSELTHMKKLYNDIIYFIQHHVAPVSSSSHSHQAQLYKAVGSSSVTITEQPVAAESSIKLFGVALNGKKRLHEEATEVPE